VRHLEQDENGRIAGAVFQVGQVAFRHACRKRNRLARHAAAGAQRAHALAECPEKGVAADVGARLGFEIGLGLTRRWSCALGGATTSGQTRMLQYSA
jgi:hypothetical protein